MQEYLKQVILSKKPKIRAKMSKKIGKIAKKHPKNGQKSKIGYII